MPLPMSMSLSTGTTCSSTPVTSRSRRTRPVVALSGTTTVIVWVARSRLAGLTVSSARLPLLSMVVKTTRSLLRSPLACSVMDWPLLAAATPAWVGVPLAALAWMRARCEVPARSDSSASV